MVVKNRYLLRESSCKVSRYIYSVLPFNLLKKNYFPFLKTNDECIPTNHTSRFVSDCETQILAWRISPNGYFLVVGLIYLFDVLSVSERTISVIKIPTSSKLIFFSGEIIKSVALTCYVFLRFS